MILGQYQNHNTRSRSENTPHAGQESLSCPGIPTIIELIQKDKASREYARQQIDLSNDAC